MYEERVCHPLAEDGEDRLELVLGRGDAAGCKPALHIGLATGRDPNVTEMTHQNFCGGEGGGAWSRRPKDGAASLGLSGAGGECDGNDT